MKKTVGRIIRKSIAIIASVAILAAPVNAATITQWNFGSTTGTLTPSTGSGTAANVGSTSSGFATGVTGQGWNTSTYPASGSSASNKKAGVQFTVSTAGYQNITLTYDHRGSNTANNSSVVQYTLDATLGSPTWFDFTTFTVTPAASGAGDTWFSRSVDFTSITGLNNNANAAFRIVSNQVTSGTYLALRSTSTYATGGTWRFDNVTLSGDVSGGPSAQNTTLDVVSGTTTNSTAYSGSTDANTAGSGSLIKTGLGTLVLTGSSFYTGSTQIQEGVVSVATLTGTAGPLGNGGSIAIGTGSTAGTLAYTGGDVSSARAYSLGAGGSTIDVSANNLTISTAITGSGGLTKTGAGTLTLTGNNTYTGNTVISGGVLDLNGASSGVDDNATVTIQNGATLKSTGDNETLGPIVLTSGTIVTDGANQFRSPSFTVSQGAINGILANKTGTAAPLTKTTAGTVTINAAQAYTGATNVNAGTLALGASGAVATSPTVNVASGATLDVSAVTGGFTLGATQTLAGAGSVVGSAAVSGTVSPGDSGAIGTLTLGATTLNGGGVLNVSLFDANSTAGTGWDLLSTGALTFANSSGSKFTINLSSASTSGGAAGNATNFNNANDASFKIVGASSFGTAFDATAFTLTTSGFTNALGGGSWALTSQGSDIYVSFTAGQALNWVGGNGNWTPTGGTDWSGGAWNSDKTATFAGTAGTVTVDNAGVSAGRGLDFGVTGYTVTGGPIALSGSTAGLNSISVGSGSATVASVLTGNAGLTKAGAGTVVLAGDNTFTGGTQINAGTVQLGNGGTAGTIVGGVTIGSGATLAVNRSDALTLAGTLTGAGVLSKAGAGTLTLSGSNDYAGGTTVTGGAVAVDAVSRLGSGALTLNGGRLNYTGGVGTLASGSIGASGGTFDVGTGGDLTITALTGTANSLVKEGAGTLRVPTLPATFSANAGVLSTAQVGTLNVGTDLANAGTIEFTGSNTRVNLNVNQTGSGVLRLTQSGQSVANTGSNITGTAANPIALAVGSGTVNIGATSGNTLRLNGAISGTGNVNFAVGTSGGAGLTVLGAASTFTGNVTVNSSASGIHRIGVNNAIPTTAGVTFGSTAGSIDLNGFNQQLAYLASGASGGIYNSAAGLSTLTIDGTTSTTYARSIGTSGSATIALVKAGSSTLTLSGSSAYSGGTTINAGTLVAGNAAAFGSGAINVTGGTLDLGSFAINNAVNVAGGSLANAASYSGATTITGTVALGSIPNSAVTVAAGGVLQGTPTVASLAGAGLVSPGSSPGIITAGTLDPSGGIDFALEFTGTTPDYGTASASVNDVIRLTAGSPFLSNLSAGNVVDVYLNVGSIAVNDTYEGGFFTTLSANNLLTALSGATFNFFGKATGGSVTFNGESYNPLTSFAGITGATVSTTAATANFGAGPVSGSSMQFVIVPEPSSLALAGLGVALAGLAAWKRRRAA
jgi:autotransporter-associated beta strand protein